MLSYPRPPWGSGRGTQGEDDRRDGIWLSLEQHEQPPPGFGISWNRAASHLVTWDQSLWTVQLLWD